MTREDPYTAARRYNRESFSIGQSGVGGFAMALVVIFLLFGGLSLANRFDGATQAAIRVAAVVLAIAVPVAFYRIASRLRQRLASR